MIFDRPIIFIDIEATGLKTESDRILELSFCKVLWISEEELPTRETKTRRFNPEMPIPEESTAIHGITNEMVKDEPPFRKVAKALHAMLQGCDLAGYNSNKFDFPILRAEFSRAGIEWDYTQHRFFDAGNVFKIMEARTLAAAYKFYCGKTLEGAHGAEADIMATVDVFISQLNRYSAPEHAEIFTPKTPDELALFSNYGNEIVDLSGKLIRNKDGVLCFNFGDSKGQPVSENVGLIGWMEKKNFPSDTMKILYAHLSY